MPNLQATGSPTAPPVEPLWLPCIPLGSPLALPRHRVVAPHQNTLTTTTKPPKLSCCSVQQRHSSASFHPPDPCRVSLIPKRRSLGSHHSPLPAAGFTAVAFTWLPVYTSQACTVMSLEVYPPIPAHELKLKVDESLVSTGPLVL